MTDIGANGHDLGDIAQGLQEEGLIRTAHGDAHDPALLGEPLHNVAADKSRSAEDCRDGCSHGFLQLAPAQISHHAREWQQGRRWRAPEMADKGATIGNPWGNCSLTLRSRWRQSAVPKPWWRNW